jgi:DNA-binding transcriptional ArsR family regulator
LEPSSIFRVKADLLRALSHPLRLEIIQNLRNGEKSVSGLMNHFGAGQPNLSRHLFILKSAGILGSRRERKTVYYFVKGKSVFDMLLSITRIIGRQKSRVEGRVSL